MSHILHIDTSVTSASVCLSDNENVVQFLAGKEQKNHAAFLQHAITEILNKENVTPKSLAAVSVTNGPGSYTGLRIGMATAKGLCYALNIPLITISTFEVMTVAAINIIQANGLFTSENDLLCPMIDARRMEVFTALLNKKLDYIDKPSSIILSNNTFIRQLNNCKIFFYGNGCSKFKMICHHPNAHFIESDFDASHMVSLSNQCFMKKNFANLAYVEPFYGKEFYSVVS
ncbi:MAG TPA: tRNA (adenosine(37)-N6)-threonylcarbamoyltransferase complex dimerization subunit type 1 TsaB [Chitinophagaceae bacterium]|nr:tRNA (adenosine(37)-N6)-threonylcarbamoyltransferase complex dimerization subunit type 1 TsaB [Chitinophagaceae bacterium]